MNRLPLTRDPIRLTAGGGRLPALADTPITIPPPDLGDWS
jgi:hypothetical protein